MSQDGALGFSLKNSRVRQNIFIPKYYDPGIQDRLDVLASTHDLLVLGELLERHEIRVSAGHEIGKMAYGTGTIPFVRTSDISNWEIKADPKQGVSADVYDRYTKREDVQANDVLFVRDGTYLIGQACVVTDHDLPLLYQSHILKFRVGDTSSISPYLFLAAMSTPIVRRQIRAKQFTADIIDTIGDRYRELVLPIPKDKALCEKIDNEVRQLIAERAQLMERLGRLPFLAVNKISSLEASLPADEIARDPDEGNIGFTLRSNQIRSNILVARYYNPEIEEDLAGLSPTHELVAVGDLTKCGVLKLSTGIEVGKMAYGTGPIPFIRTSDISNWELKFDPKQSVSTEIYESVKQKLDVQEYDIYLVRDGTYLVGISCILTSLDTANIFCGGLYKIRVQKKGDLDPFLLLALLNTPIVRLQMRAKQFTRDVIDTLGKRILEVVLPIPKDPATRGSIAKEVREAIQRRAELRSRARQLPIELEGQSEEALGDS